MRNGFPFFTGIDLPKLYTVVHYGMPANLDQYMQESGRVGRDGKPSNAVILYHSNALRGNVGDDSKEYLRNIDSCRRLMLLKYFGEELKTAVARHSCCDICLKSCDCGLCSDFFSIPERLHSSTCLNPGALEHSDLSENSS